MAITHYYVRATNGADVAGQGTTHMTAYQTPQFALDDVGATHGRNAVDGDQINICDAAVEGANVLGAVLSLATYGTPTLAAPLVLRGYTATANDGGVGEIDCGGFTMWASGYNVIVMADLECHTFGNNHGVLLGTDCLFYRVEAHKGASSPASKHALYATTTSQFIGCYVHDYNGNGISLGGAESITVGNRVEAITGIGILLLGRGNAALGNIVSVAGVTDNGISSTVNRGQSVQGNIVWHSGGGTGYGIQTGDGASEFHSAVLNNIVIGFSGVGGVAIGGQHCRMLGHNAFYNNTANVSLTQAAIIDLTANDVALAADPFVDAANGNFALTDAAKLLLRSAGWPGSYLGASTDPHVTIGAVQYGEAVSGGGVIRRAMRLIGG